MAVLQWLQQLVQQNKDKYASNFFFPFGIFCKQDSIPEP